MLKYLQNLVHRPSGEEGGGRERAKEEADEMTRIAGEQLI